MRLIFCRRISLAFKIAEVTLLAGFPVPIGTPGHGTAYDIAGKGVARREGFETALALVSRMAGHRCAR